MDVGKLTPKHGVWNTDKQKGMKAHTVQHSPFYATIYHPYAQYSTHLNHTELWECSGLNIENKIYLFIPKQCVVTRV